VYLFLFFVEDLRFKVVKKTMKDNEEYYFKEALEFFLAKKNIWTQTWLAKKTGIKQQTISKILRGISQGKEKNRIKIARAFKMDLLSFLNKGKQIFNKKNGIQPLTNHNIEHYNIIDEFQNQQLATEINDKLVEIEKTNPEYLEELNDILELKLKRVQKETVSKGVLKKNKGA
jgi:transcriptional regulator with XRE-family HTH domain